MTLSKTCHGADQPEHQWLLDLELRADMAAICAQSSADSRPMAHLNERSYGTACHKTGEKGGPSTASLEASGQTSASRPFPWWCQAVNQGSAARSKYAKRRTELVVAHGRPKRLGPRP